MEILVGREERKMETSLHTHSMYIGWRWYFIGAILASTVCHNQFSWADGSGHEAVSGLSFANDGSSVVVSYTFSNGRLRLLSPETFSSKQTIELKHGWISSSAISSTGSLVATANWDGTISLVNTTTWRQVGVLRGHHGPVLCVIFFGDGTRLCSSGRDGHIIIWNVETKSVEHDFGGHKMWVECLATSPDSKLLASGDWDGKIKIWDLKTKECTATIPAHQDAVLSLAFSPDGRVLASGAQDRQPLKLWHAADWNEQAVLRHEGMSVRCVLFLSDDQLACGSNDRTIQIWDTKKESCVSVWHAHEKGWVMRLTLSPDKTHFASGDLNGEVKMWRVADIASSQNK